METDNNQIAKPRVFIASEYWRGAMNVGCMRTFDNEPDALKYVANMHSCRVYELFNNKEPRRVLAR